MLLVDLPYAGAVRFFPVHDSPSTNPAVSDPSATFAGSPERKFDAITPKRAWNVPWRDRVDERHAIACERDLSREKFRMRRRLAAKCAVVRHYAAALGRDPDDDGAGKMTKSAAAGETQVDVYVGSRSGRRRTDCGMIDAIDFAALNPMGAEMCDGRPNLARMGGSNA